MRWTKAVDRMKAVHYRHWHSSARVLRKAGGVVRNTDATQSVASELSNVSETSGSSEVEEQEVMFFSQDKDILPEVEIKPFRQIKSETWKRFEKRYVGPSVEWYRSIDEENGWLARGAFETKSSMNELKESSIKWLISSQGSSKSFFFRPDSLIGSSLQPGDLCILSSDHNELVMCVKSPSESMDARFSFAKADGSVVYARKSKVHLRFPRLHSTIGSHLLQREGDHGYDPIGSIKNDKDTTFIIPTLARMLVISNITYQISEDANTMLPIVKKKLELLHRYLQSNMGPWQLPLFKLVELCTNLELSSDIDRCVVEAFKKSGVSSESLYSLADSHLELSMKLPETIDCAHFLAVYRALLQQQGTQMWGKLTVHRGVFFPTSITVLPLSSQHLHYHSLIYKLKKYDGALIKKFVGLVNQKKLIDIKRQFPDILTLLRDYAAGNVNNNAQVVSLIASLFRKLDDSKDLDLTRDTCFQLLKQIHPEEPPNPLLNNHELQLPVGNDRVKLEQKIYDLATPSDIPSQWTNRTEYKDLVCYCIDSPDAHEIDDAVSITNISKTRYKIFIHVADPASLFPQSNDVSKSIQHPILDIAYQRAFTTYLPDKVFPMLPTTFARTSDLGQFGTPTKALTISVECTFSKNRGIILDKDTINVELSILHKSKRTTYEKVDEILKNGEDSEIQTLYGIAKALRRNRVVNHGAVLFEGDQKGLVTLLPDENSDLTVVSFKDSVETKSTILVSELMILANSLTAKYFVTKDIPGIFRGYRSLNVVEEATSIYDWVKTKTKKGRALSKADITKMKSFLTNSFYTSKPTTHDMIGSEQYLTVTSPLRRYPDMINHLQLHRHLRNLPLLFSQQDLDGIMWHILARDISIKDASTQSNIYWTLRFLKERSQDPEKNSWNVLVTSLTELGYVQCTIVDKSFATGRLKINPNKKPLLVGDTVSACKITSIDCLDGVLDFEFSSGSKVDRKST